MANRYFKQFQKTLESEICALYGSFVTSTSGTVSSSSAKGFTIAKTATEVGRYTVTLQDKYAELKVVNAVIVGATDAAYTTGKGFSFYLRNVAVGTTGTFDIQFVETAVAYADTELADAAAVRIEIVLKNSSIAY